MSALYRMWNTMMAAKFQELKNQVPSDIELEERKVQKYRTTKINK